VGRALLIGRYSLVGLIVNTFSVGLSRRSESLIDS
jgi:hypothetical protein